jgi:outer membrane protein assembly factor BamB
VVYVADTGRTLYALDAEDGRERWRREVAGDPVGAPVVAHDALYLATGGGVYAFDPDSGDGRWDGADDRRPTGTPAVAGGRLFVGTEYDGLCALDAGDGETVWTADAETSATAPVVAGDAVVAGRGDGTVIARAGTDGCRRWTVGTDEPVATRPATDGQLVVVGGEDGTVLAVREEGAIDAGPPDIGTVARAEATEWRTDQGTMARTGHAGGGGPVAPADGVGPLWQVEAPGNRATLAVGPAVVDGTVYAADGADSLCAWDLATSERRWREAVAGQVNSAAAVADGTVYFAGEDRRVHALSAATGEPVWETELTGSDLAVIRTDPTLHDGTVYLGTSDGTLHALDADTGAETAVFDLDDQATGTPVVVDGLVVAGAEGGTFSAFDTDSGERAWTFRGGRHEPVSPVAGERVVYLPTDEGLAAVDPANGEAIWTSAHHVSATPALVDGSLFLGCSDDTLRALDAATGDGRWAVEDVTAPTSPTAVADGVVYVGTADGQLRAFDAATGDGRWTHAPELGEETVEFTDTLAVAEGSLVAATGHRLATYQADPDPDQVVETPSDDRDLAPGAGGEPGEYVQVAVESVSDPSEPTDEELRAVILGVLCDEWVTGARAPRLEFGRVVTIATDRLEGATEGLLRYNLDRLAEDLRVELRETGNSALVTGRAFGIQRYEELTGTTVVEDRAFREVLEPLHEQARHNPQQPTLSREALQDETTLDDDELDRVVWYLSDIGTQVADVLYIDDGTGYLEILATGSGVWSSAKLTSAGRQLYENL